MAIDYFHRLVVWGTRARVTAFAASARRRVRYPTIGREKGFTETVGFSFHALWQAYPALTRVSDVAPYDAYQVRTWPVTRETARLHFARYQFQTRDMEMRAIVRGLSKACPHVTFVLMTDCLDVSEIESWLMTAGRTTHYRVPERMLVKEVDAEAARRGVSSDSDPDGWLEAQEAMEHAMMARALAHWDRRLFGSRPRHGAKTGATSIRARGPWRRGTLDWWDRPEQRDRFTELPLLLELDTRGDKGMRARLGFDALDRDRRKKRQRK
jgi:hypothetical protein